MAFFRRKDRDLDVESAMQQQWKARKEIKQAIAADAKLRNDMERNHYADMIFKILGETKDEPT